MTRVPTTQDLESSVHLAAQSAAEHVLALMIAWSADEPHRAGEVALFEMEGSARVLGRGEGPSGERVQFGWRRPGSVRATSSLDSPRVSRDQLRITPLRGKLHVERVGRCATLVRGEKVDVAELAPGETLVLRGQVVLYCTMRPAVPTPLHTFPADALGEPGEPDHLGLLGESPAMWALRDRLAFHAKTGAHTLILGPSGAGKELCARGIHELSPRATGPFVARNAATLPSGLVDAELFGNAKNYPNPGMPERPGLVGAAHGGTLFLDEIGELPASLHANLLRLLDDGSEYHRLGEAVSRRADLRLIGATNRAPESLKHDLLARFSMRLPVPGLDERRDDIPLLIRHLLRRALVKSPELVGRFARPNGEVRVSGALVEHLMHRPYTTHVRELDGLLWRAMSESPGDEVSLPESLAREVRSVGRGGPPSSGPLASEESLRPSRPLPEEEDRVSFDGGDPERARLLGALALHNNNLVKTAEALGLPSRYALYRMLRRHRIDVRSLRGQPDGSAPE
ncbi:MAG: sigma 54-interacting transcriptional regulator [Polyangiaceae bacterium]